MRNDPVNADAPRGPSSDKIVKDGETGAIVQGHHRAIAMEKLKEAPPVERKSVVTSRTFNIKQPMPGAGKGDLRRMLEEAARNTATLQKKGGDQ